MSSPQDVVRVLFAYVKQTHNPRVRFDNLRVFTDRFARKFVGEYPELSDLVGEGNGPTLERHLSELETDKKAELERDDSGLLKSVFFPSYFSLEIQRWYTRVQDDRTLPLPSEADLGIALPVGLAEVVEVATSFMEWLGNEEADQNLIIRLRFPHGIREGITTVGMINGPLAVVAFSRVREYLRTGQNAGYMSTRLRGLLQGKDVSVHEMLQMIATKPDEALLSIREPNEFQFLFWSQLSNAIMKEYVDKTDRMEAEHAFCQGALLLGYYAVFFKGRHQRVMEWEAALKSIEEQLQQPPYLFTLQDVYAFNDKKGVPLLKRLDKESVNARLNQLMTPEPNAQIAQIVSFNTEQNRGLMVHVTQYIPIVLKRLAGASKAAHEQLVAEMTNLLYSESSADWMNGDAAFERRVSDWLREADAVLFSMLNFQLLFLIADSQNLSGPTREAVYRLFDRTKRDMMPCFRMLDLDREDLLQEAKLRLPLWMIIPIIRGIVKLFRGMFGGAPTKKRQSKAQVHPSQTRTPSAGEGGEKAKGPSSAEQKKLFKEQIARLQQAYLSDGQTPEQRLRELHSEWNPLLDKTAAKNLEADVNSLCRDTLRKMKVGARMVPPDRSRIQELAKRIASNSTFDRIRKRGAFQAYLELYMLTALSK